MANGSDLRPEEKISALFSIFNDLVDSTGIRKCQLICAGNEFLSGLRNDINVLNTINSELMSENNKVTFVSAELSDKDPETVSP